MWARSMDYARAFNGRIALQVQHDPAAACWWIVDPFPDERWRPGRAPTPRTAWRKNAPKPQ